MGAHGLIAWLVIGAVAGWLAGQIMKGSGLGTVGNIILGCIGAVVGGFVFGLLGISSGDSLIGSLITALVGAVILLFIVRLVKKSK